MAEYEIMYQLNQRPQARTDGSGCVDHVIYADYRTEGTQDPWAPIPGKNTVISVPASDIQDALSTGTNAQKAAAYKQAIAGSLGTPPTPITGWAVAELEAQLEANAAASAAASAAHEFITVDLGQSYPVRFSI